jgi:hypothetical protein
MDGLGHAGHYDDRRPWKRETAAAVRISMRTSVSGRQTSERFEAGFGCSMLHALFPVCGNKA